MCHVPYSVATFLHSSLAEKHRDQLSIHHIPQQHRHLRRKKREMGEVVVNGHAAAQEDMVLVQQGGAGAEVEIYPLSCYYFGAKGMHRDYHVLETTADRILRLNTNFAAHGLRTCVYGVLLVELFEHPHVLVLQVRNSSFLLPGGRLRPGEQDVEGLKRKLSRKLSLNETTALYDDWQIGECIGMWWRSEFETLPFPYLPPNIRKPKECIKLFLIRLPMSRQFVAPRNLKLLAVPLCQIHDNPEVYGPIISGIPHLLSKFSFNIIRD